MMKRYLLFSGEWEGEGGWGDFRQDFDDHDEAREAGKRMAKDADTQHNAFWWHVVDIETGQIVSNGDNAIYEQEARPL